MAEKKQNTNTTDIEIAFNEKLEAMLAMATKKAEEIIADAEKKAEEIINSKLEKANATPEADEDLQKQLAYMEEYVPFKAFKDNGKYKDDIFVAVNGETCLIKRGVQTQIKRKFLEVLRNSAEQNEYAASYSEALQEEYESRRDRLE